MRGSAKNAVVSLLIFIGLDGIWLKFISTSFYQSHIGHLMSETPDFRAALLFYLLFLVGLHFFVIHPQHDAPLKKVALHGAFFGCVTYATFDLTSVAVFKDFPYLVAFVDLLWGSFLCMSIATGTLAIHRWSSRS